MVAVNWPITISQQRTRWNAVNGHPAIRLRSKWGAQRSYTDARAVEDGPATRIFIHISVTNPGNYRGNDAHAQAIERIGISRFPSTGISYNFGVMPNAALYEFQPVGRRGAHTVNDYRISTCTRSGTGCPGRNQPLTARSWNLNYNARSIVICQNVNDPVTDAQIDIIARTLVCGYQAKFWTKHACHSPHGHRCVSSKSCPGNKMWARMGHLHTKIHHYLNNGLSSTAPPPRPPEGDWLTMADKADVKDAFREVLKEGLAWMPDGKHLAITTAISRTYRGVKPDAIAKAVHHTDGVIPAPPSHPAAQDGTNTHWYNSSHQKNQTEAVMYTIPAMLVEMRGLLDALLQSELGDDAETVKAHITSLHEQTRADLGARIDVLSAQVDKLEGGQAEMLDVVNSALSGETGAMEALTQLHQMIGELVNAPPAPEEPDDEPA